MTLVAWGPPDGVEVLIEWLKPLGEVRDDRPTGAVLPYRMVHRIDGPFDGLVDKGVYSIHTFAATKAQAQAGASDTHRRLEYLVSRFSGQQKVAISGGREVQADNVITVEYPHWIQWVGDNSIHQFVGTYEVHLRIMAV